MKTKNNPLISVLIPTFNRGRVIKRAIESVQRQTYKNLEIIVVDDGSTDKTKETVKKIKDKRIIIISHRKNKGAGAARNTGIRKARGDYIAFLDSDDQWLANKLEKQIKLFKKGKDIGVVYCRYYIIKGKTKKKTSFPEIKKYNGWLHKQLLVGNFITTSSALLKKEIIQKAGFFDENLPAYQDWEFFLRVSKKTKFRFINEVLLNQYQDEKDRISDSKEKRIQAVSFILKKHQADIKRNRHLYARFLSMGNKRIKAWLTEPENLRFLKEIFSK